MFLLTVLRFLQAAIFENISLMFLQEGPKMYWIFCRAMVGAEFKWCNCQIYEVLSFFLCFHCLIAASGDTFDWQKVCFAFTLDSIGEIGFGKSLECLGSIKQKQPMLPFATAFDDAQRLVLIYNKCFVQTNCAAHLFELYLNNRL